MLCIIKAVYLKVKAKLGSMINWRDISEVSEDIDLYSHADIVVPRLRADSDSSSDKSVIKSVSNDTAIISVGLEDAALIVPVPCHSIHSVLDLVWGDPLVYLMTALSSDRHNSPWGDKANLDPLVGVEEPSAPSIVNSTCAVFGHLVNDSSWRRGQVMLIRGWGEGESGGDCCDVGDRDLIYLHVLLV